jgi:hypothetical protein
VRWCAENAKKKLDGKAGAKCKKRYREAQGRKVMPHGKSPITSPIIPDKTPIRSGAAVQSIDELLWALIELLVENGAINSAELSTKVESLLALGIRRDGPLATDDEDRFGESLALERVRDALRRLPSPR